MRRVYIVTGAYGHLGSTIVRKLKETGARVRALILPQDKLAGSEQMDIELVEGDVRNKESMRPLFEGLDADEVVVIHTAAIVDIRAEVSPNTYEVNVNGTKNLIELCLEHQIHRYIHVSSVHAIPEPKDLRVIKETKDFSPDTVSGNYAKTKAEASRYVMNCIREKGLPAIILHPSGIIGPCDPGRNHIVQGIIKYLNGEMPTCPNAGYDFVDVRDVADACIAAVDKGRVGETYILSNRHYSMPELFKMLHLITGQKAMRYYIPMWVCKAAASISESLAKRSKVPPSFTKYSLETLESNDKFSCEKAVKELGYKNTDMYDTLKDTAVWLSQQKLIRSQEKL